MTKWHYDIKSDTCYPFDYTGCGSEQANRFEDETECLNHCSITQYKNNQTQLTDTEASSIILKCQIKIMSFKFFFFLDFIVDICDLELETGKCTQFSNRWFYDKNLKECRAFQYSGCDGT